MIALMLWTALAVASQWAPPRALDALLDATGVWELPGGEPARLDVDPPGSIVEVVSEDGTRVSLQGYGDSILVPAAARSRRLRVSAGDDVAVRVRLLEYRDQDGAWLRYEREVLEALGAGEPERIGLPPSGSERLAASLRLRARALGSVDIEQLGALADLSKVRPIRGGALVFDPLVARQSEPDRPVEVPVVGPGLVTWVAQPLGEGFFRYDVAVSLDDGPVGLVPLAGTGSSRRAERLFVPPGAHVLRLGSASTPVSFSVARRRNQRPLLGSWPGLRGPTSGLDEAERRYLAGEAGALELFRQHVAERGPTGELARARVVVLSDDPEEREQLVGRLEDWSEDGLEVLCDAVLARPGGLPPARVEALALQAREPNLERLATWMNTLGGRRPRGQALLASATPPIPEDPSFARAALRTGSAGTRWSRLWPDAQSGPGRVMRTPEGPGIPRIVVEDRARVVLPELLGERWPTARFVTAEPAVFDLDGRRYTVSEAAELVVALPPGDAELHVLSGHVFVTNPRLVEGGRRVFEWGLADLPATWLVPDEGVPAELMIVSERPEPLMVSFDDGRVSLLEAGSGLVRVGAWAKSMTIEGPVGARAAVKMRVPVVSSAVAEPPVVPVATLEEALANLTATTERVDGGGLEARVERAAVLASLGRVSAARRDLLLASEDPALLDEVHAVEERIARQLPSAPEVGPRSVSAALAAAGLDIDSAERTPLEEATWLRELARAHPDSRSLVRLAIDRSMEAGEVEQATALAWALRSESRMERLARATPWRSVGRSDTSTGLLPVRRVVTPDPDPGVSQRIDAALLASPWPEVEVVALSEGEKDRIELAAGRLAVELYCRDLRLTGRPCEVLIRQGDTARSLQVPDGSVRRVELADGAPRRHVLEVGGPAEDQRLLVRLEADDEVARPSSERLALVLTGTPARMTVAGGALLRVEGLDGPVQVRVDGAEVPTLEQDGITTAWLGGEGPRVVTLSGETRVLVSRGLPRAPGVESVAPITVPVDETLPHSPQALLARFGPTAPASLPEVGSFGSVRVGAGLLRDLDGRDGDPYAAGELSAEYLRAGDVFWIRGGPWIRSPLGAGGLLADGGASWRRGLVGLRGETAIAGGGEASSWQLTARARQDLRLTPRWRLRAEGRAFVGRWSLPPADPVDARAWSLYRLTHPQGLALLPSAIWRPTRDLRLQAGLTGFTNPDLTLDTLGADIDMDWLVWRYTILKLDVGLRRALVDERRMEAEWRPLIALGVDHAPWVNRLSRLRIAPRVFITQAPAVVEGRLALSWLFSPGRGLRDLAPDAEAFRTSRGELP